MKITMIEVEATEDDIKATRTIGGALSDILYGIADRFRETIDAEHEEEQEDGNVDRDQ